MAAMGRWKNLAYQQSTPKDSTKDSAQGVTGSHQASEVLASSMLLYNGPQVSGDHDRGGTMTSVSFEPGTSNIDRRVMEGQVWNLTDSLKRKHVCQRTSNHKRLILTLGRQMRQQRPAEQPQSHPRDSEQGRPLAPSILN